MTAQNPSPPSPEEIGERILANLKRVQGYLDVFQSELHDPQKIGTAEERDQFSRLAEELKRNLIQLEDLFSTQPWSTSDE